MRGRAASPPEEHRPAPARSPSRFAVHGLAALAGAAAFAVYLRTLCPTVFVEGTGENIVCAWALGVPHPPGFPLFCLLAKGFATVLPVGTAAFRINLFAAAAGAAAVAALAVGLRCGGLSLLVAAGAALAYGFSATFWRQSTIAEVYTLSLLLAILQLFLLLRWRAELSAQPAAADSRPRKRGARPRPRPAVPQADRLLAWWALMWGLGMAVHFSHILLLPASLYLIIATDRGALLRARAVALMAAAALAGLSLHLYAPLRSLANPPIDWGNPETAANWWRYLTAEQYRGRMFHMPLGEVGGNLLRFLTHLPHEISWLGAAAAVAGAVALAAADRRLFGFTAIAFGVTLFWAVNYDLPWEIDVYYLLPLLMMAVWIGFALHWAARHARRAVRPLAIALAIAIPGVIAATNFRGNDLSRQHFALDSGLDVLDLVAPRSNVLLPSTNPTFSLLYLTRVERRGAGVKLWSRVKGGIVPVEQGVAPAEQVRAEPEGRFAAARLARGEAVYAVERLPQSGLPGFAQVPWGCLYRIVPGRDQEAWLSKAPDPQRTRLHLDVGRQQFAFGAEQRLVASRYLLVRGDYAWETGRREEADRHYQEALHVGAGLASCVSQVGLRYEGQGRLDAAAEVYRRALASEDSAEVHNRLGVVYGRQGRLAEAEQEFLRATALDAKLAEAHANLASVYGRRGEVKRAVPELELAVALAPDDLNALRNLGYAYLQTGRPADARSVWEQALALNAQQEDVRALLAGLPK